MSQSESILSQNRVKIGLKLSQNRVKMKSKSCQNIFEFSCQKYLQLYQMEIFQLQSRSSIVHYIVHQLLEVTSWSIDGKLNPFYNSRPFIPLLWLVIEIINHHHKVKLLSTLSCNPSFPLWSLEPMLSSAQSPLKGMKNRRQIIFYKEMADLKDISYTFFFNPYTKNDM